MIAGDVRTLARQYCSRGVAVQYIQYDNLGHVGSALVVAARSGTLARRPVRGLAGAAGLRADRAGQLAGPDPLRSRGASLEQPGLQ